MKKLSKDEMKKVTGGVVQCDNCSTGTVAHCYGTYTNCQNASYGSCDGGTNCLEYCVVGGQSDHWC